MIDDCEPPDVRRGLTPRGDAGYLPIALKPARVRVKDMLRIFDGRMSVSAFGSGVPHGSPEATAARGADFGIPQPVVGTRLAR